jgi:outer membrane protein OmpA-like peptidoglycan-associated protein
MGFVKFPRVAVVATVVATLLTGCYTYEPYSGEKQVSRTTIGAGIGAVAGAAIGMLTGGDARQHRKNALIGAGIGALAGGGAGNYMDRQQAKLREQLQGTGVQVVRKGDDITLVMPGNITFTTNSSDLNPSFDSVLNSVSLVLKEYDKTILEIAGHTDNVGKPEYNQALSERRANSVAQYLESQGVNSQRVITVGAGETKPIAPNTTPEGRQSNRRVELTLEPITAQGAPG